MVIKISPCKVEISSFKKIYDLFVHLRTFSSIRAVSFIIPMETHLVVIFYTVIDTPTYVHRIYFIILFTLLPTLLLSVECCVSSNYAWAMLRFSFSALRLGTCSSISHTPVLTAFSGVPWSVCIESIFQYRVLWSLSFYLSQRDLDPHTGIQGLSLFSQKSRICNTRLEIKCFCLELHLLQLRTYLVTFSAVQHKNFLLVCNTLVSIASCRLQSAWKTFSTTEALGMPCSLYFPGGIPRNMKSTSWSVRYWERFCTEL